MLTPAEVTDVAEFYQTSGEVGEDRSLFKFLDLKGRLFDQMQLNCTDWIECDLALAVFRDCDLRGADLTASNVKNTVFERCAMFGCELPDEPSIRQIGCHHAL